MPKPRFMFYHDGRHPLIYMYEPPIEKEEYEAGVDELVGTPVEAIIVLPGRWAHGATEPALATGSSSAWRARTARFRELTGSRFCSSSEIALSPPKSTSATWSWRSSI